MMDVSVTEIISACMSLGMMVTMNQRLDAETLTIVAEEFGYSVDFELPILKRQSKKLMIKKRIFKIVLQLSQSWVMLITGKHLYWITFEKKT